MRASCAGGDRRAQRGAAAAACAALGPQQLQHSGHGVRASCVAQQERAARRGAGGVQVKGLKIPINQLHVLRSRRARRGAACAARAALDPDNASILVAGGGGVALEITRRLKDMGAWVWQLQRSDSRRCARALRPPTCLDSCSGRVCAACAAMAVTAGMHAHAYIVVRQVLSPCGAAGRHAPCMHEHAW